MQRTVFSFLSVVALTVATSSFASGAKCAPGKFSCQVNPSQSATCCASSETCTTDTKGQASCTIPTSERQPTQATPKNAPKAKKKK